jgi:flap endonuclease-1
VHPSHRLTQIERRKWVQRSTLTRSAVETGRFKRLQQLANLYDSFSALHGPERERVTILLRAMIWESLTGEMAISGTDQSCVGGAIEWGPSDQVGPDLLWPPLVPKQACKELFSVDRHALAQILPTDIPVPRQGHSTPATACASEPPPEYGNFPASAEAISTAIASLYFSYRRSCSLLTVPPPVDENDVDIDHPIESVFTKAQHQLTLVEGHLWSTLFQTLSSSSRTTRHTTSAALAALAGKSRLMSDSYQRRATPPTAQTYAECKEILRAMGVPCVQPAGPYEAEALAAALVIRGLADYVASEDTVRPSFRLSLGKTRNPTLT